MGLLPGIGFTSSKYKTIPPKEFTVHYLLTINIYITSRAMDHLTPAANEQCIRSVI